MDGPSGTASAPTTAAMPGRQITMAELMQIRDNFGFIKVADIELGEARARALGQQHAEARPSVANSSSAASSFPTHNVGDTPSEERPVLLFPPIQGADDQPASVPAPPMATWPQQPVNNDPQDLLTAAANNTAPRRKNKGGNKRHIKSTANVVAEPHHTKLGSFAGMTMDQLFTPGNGIDIDTFFGAKALYIAAHIPSPKRVEARINEKHQIENNTDQLLVKQKLFNHRLKNALKHKFGPSNVKESKVALERAQKDDQARQDYIAMLQADDISEANPLSICTIAGCPRNYARSQASQSNSSASIPAATLSGNAPAAGPNLWPVIADETSGEDPLSAPYTAAADTVGGASSRPRKRSLGPECIAGEPEPSTRTGAKRRKLNGGGVKDGVQQMDSSCTPCTNAAQSAGDSNDDSCLDPALREQTHSGTSDHESQFSAVAAPATSSDRSANVSNPSIATAVARHDPSPLSVAQADSATDAVGDQIGTITKDSQTSEQAPESFSGLSPHRAASTSTAPDYHEN
ncbi:hypothetical protein CKM354_000024600 [Cercospora kikuchii]|uniref:Uncharacterized protein n=1 Tax=Cercospora kikuchii TaxID=84275 RepID=A0A9P3FBF1_9PEZI|nr:uncharacterized protein CKM354_000024600 [Cercospora kikuchii]GIZ36779.1 hypothetical protein CKM354_000024600 [Cercospora kikuchii]